MTKGEVKRFLRQARAILHEVQRLEGRICELSYSREHITPSYSGMPGGGRGNKLADVTAKIIELEEEQKEKRLEYLKRYREIEAAIMFVEGVDMWQAQVLRLRYLEGMSWEKIAVDLHYSIRRVYYLHKQGLKVIADNAITTK